MDTQEHPDPFADAAQHGVQRAVQVASCAMTAGQVYLYQRRAQARVVAEQAAQARRVLNAQVRAERDAARAAWAPALDREWLRNAPVMDTAGAWGAAMPYADRSVPWYEPGAATALRKSEERLRHLHPYAMARYDRLRGDGMGPSEAMFEAAPLFARHPTARGGYYAPRPALAPQAARLSSPTTRSDRPWERDFPIPITEVVAISSRAAPHGGSLAPKPSPTAAPQPPRTSPFQP
jgi:hypothetical protein